MHLLRLGSELPNVDLPAREAPDVDVDPSSAPSGHPTRGAEERNRLPGRAASPRRR